MPELKTPELTSQSKQRNPSYYNRDIPMAFAWPIKDALISQEFKERSGRRRGHLGIDLAAPKGSGVYSSHDGLVIYAGRQFRGFGKLIIIESPEGEWATLYSHLDRILIQQGERVRQGQLIGTVGRTGRATGYHLHFEVRKNKEPVNPMSLLP